MEERRPKRVLISVKAALFRSAEGVSLIIIVHVVSLAIFAWFATWTPAPPRRLPCVASPLPAAPLLCNAACRRTPSNSIHGLTPYFGGKLKDRRRSSSAVPGHNSTEKVLRLSLARARAR